MKINEFLLSRPKDFHLSYMCVFSTVLVLQDNDLNIHRSDIRPINRKFLIRPKGIKDKNFSFPFKSFVFNGKIYHPLGSFNST